MFCFRPPVFFCWAPWARVPSVRFGSNSYSFGDTPGTLGTQPRTCFGSAFSTPPLPLPMGRLPIPSARLLSQAKIKRVQPNFANSINKMPTTSAATTSGKKKPPGFPEEYNVVVTGFSV